MNALTVSGDRAASKRSFLADLMTGWRASLVVGLVCRIGYWLVAGMVWDDARIFQRYAENLVAGHGLVYNPGESVWGFSSVIWQMIMAIGALFPVTDGPIHAARLVALVAYVATHFHMAAIVDREVSQDCQRLTPWLRVLPLWLLAVEPRTVSFSMSGMETSITLLAIAWIWNRASRGALGGAGVLAAAAVLVRPELAIWGAALLASCLAVKPRIAVKEVGWGALLLGAVVLPLSLYYGFWLPHTVSAKMAGYQVALDWAARMDAISILTPLNPDQIPSALKLPIRLTHALLLAAIVSATLFSRTLTLGSRAMADATLIHLAYLSSTPSFFGWYRPPATLAVGILAALALARLSLHQPRVAALALAGGYGVAAAFALLMPVFLLRDRVNHLAIEQGVRGAAGRWLAVNSAPDATVYTESLGAIGHQSRRRMLDYPGLVTPQAVRALKDTVPAQRDIATAIPMLKPDYLVLRAHEVDQCRSAMARAGGYVEVASFTAEPPGGMLGRLLRNGDRDYRILRAVRLGGVREVGGGRP